MTFGCPAFAVCSNSVLHIKFCVPHLPLELLVNTFCLSALCRRVTRKQQDRGVYVKDKGPCEPMRCAESVTCLQAVEPKLTGECAIQLVIHASYAMCVA